MPSQPTGAEPRHPNPPPASRIDRSLFPGIIHLTLPLAVTGQLENLVGFADLFMVRKLGPAAISAVGISNQVVMLMGITMVAVTTGTMTLVAQAIGAKSMTEASSAAKQSLLLIGMLSVLISLVGVAGARPMLVALSVAPEVVALGTPYLRVFFAGISLMTLNFVLTTCLQAAGDTRTPMYISVLINAVKLGASYLFIFGFWEIPPLGVTGAALGTLVGRLCGLGAGFCVAYSGRFRFGFVRGTRYRFNLQLARRLLRIGVPSALQGLFRNGSNLIFVKFVALSAQSTTAVAAFSIGNQVERVLRRTSLAFGTAATALVGQSLGAGDPEAADRRGWTTQLAAVVTGVLLGLPVIFFAGPMMRLFSQQAGVIEIGTRYLYAIALSEPFLSASITSGGGLRGAGDTIPAFRYTVISLWFVRLPAAYLLGFTLGLDTSGLWTALFVSAVAQGVLTVRIYAKGDWKTRKA
jgi:putative MATE family efflux protein